MSTANDQNEADRLEKERRLRPGDRGYRSPEIGGNPISVDGALRGAGFSGNVSTSRGGRNLSPQEKDILEKRLLDSQADKFFLDDQRKRIAKDREAGRTEGRRFAKNYFSKSQEGSGMVDASATPEMMEILERRKSDLGGLNATQNQAAREQAFKGMSARNQGDSRALRARLGSRGLRGAAAAGAELDLAKNQAAESTNLEQRLLLDNVNLKNKALQDYESTFGSQRADLLNRRTANVNRSDQFRQGRAGSELGFAGVYGGERTEALGKLLGDKGLEAVKASGGGGKKHICGELRRRGLLTSAEYSEMTMLSLKALFFWGRFSCWYFKNAKKLIQKINDLHPEYNWKSVKTDLVDPALDKLRAGDYNGASLHYGRILLSLDRVYNKGEWPEFQYSFFSKGIFKNLIGSFQVVMMPDFWRTAVKVVRVWFRIKKMEFLNAF